MPLPREKKEVIIQELEEELEKSPSIILADFQGLNAKSIAQLRNTLRDNDIKFKVYKNTLIKKAVQKMGLERLATHLAGCTGIAFAKGDSLLPVRLLYRYSLDSQNLFKLKIALLEEKVFLEEELQRVALLPDKEELLVKMLGNMKGPISSFVYMVRSPLSGLINVLEQIRKRKSE